MSDCIIPDPPGRPIDRRRFVVGASAAGLGTAWAAALRAALAEPSVPTREALAAAETLAGLEFTEAERTLMREGVEELRGDYESIRGVALDNSVPPAVQFNPHPPGWTRERSDGAASEGRTGGMEPAPPGARPASGGVAPALETRRADDLAFLSVGELGSLVARREVSSLELTRLYLDRLRELGPRLECVVSPTEERALREAEDADREIAAGRYRGPLHGIPWGAKDLLAARGYRTTWGATPYRRQVIDEDAAVVERLGEAGAVLVAKLTLGALAWGDVWFGGRTRNPWNLEQGSSGSSAGSAAATAAALVGFSIGSETWGSIVSPSTRCGATGLRPTFGRVSRHGAMALSWSMDKLGPICRSAEDCALVLEAIAGPDRRDPSAVGPPFAWDPGLDPRALRVGYVRSLFEGEAEEGREEWHAHDLQTLETLRDLGVRLAPIELPDLPVAALSFILSVEAAAAFDELTRSGRDDLLVRQVRNAWPNTLREARMVPAVEYVQANRVRTLAMARMAELFREIDAYVCPSFGGDNLLLTNLTGHPCVVLPNGFRTDGTPTSVTFVGDLDRDGEILALARLYQQATDFHRRHPAAAAGEPA